MTMTSASALFQVVPDPDPSAEGEYGDRAAGAASGCEECWHPGKAVLELVRQSDPGALGSSHSWC